MDKDFAQDELKRAFAFYQKGQYDKALDLLNDLEEAYPNTKGLLYARARCLAATGETEAARKLCIYMIKEFGAKRAQVLLAELDGPESVGDGDFFFNSGVS